MNEIIRLAKRLSRRLLRWILRHRREIMRWLNEGRSADWIMATVKKKAG